MAAANQLPSQFPGRFPNRADRRHALLRHRTGRSRAELGVVLGPGQLSVRPQPAMISPGQRGYMGPCEPPRRSSSRWRAAGAAR